jgi:hypothetical protein
MKFYFILFFVLISVTSYCQNQINHKTFSFISIISNEMYEEALEKKIKSDRLIISFVLNDSCSVSEFKIEKEGTLESFSKSVLKNSKKFFKELEDYFCIENDIDKYDRKRKKYCFPIWVKFEF